MATPCCFERIMHGWLDLCEARVVRGSVTRCCARLIGALVAGALVAAAASTVIGGDRKAASGLGAVEGAGDPRGWYLGAGRVNLPEQHQSRAPRPEAGPSDEILDPAGSLQLQVRLNRQGEILPGSEAVVWMPELLVSGRGPGRSGGSNGTATSSRYSGSGSPSADQEPVRYEIRQQGKEFKPRVLAVPVGSTVDFPNHDRVFHNVFSLSAPKQFDLGLYRKGRSRSELFDRSGLIQVYCNIHPHMTAYLWVIDSEIFGVTSAEGKLVLDNLPPGRWSIEGWHDQGGRWSRAVDVSSGRRAELSVELDVSSWRPVPHKNKHGKDYPPPDDDDFRY